MRKVVTSKDVPHLWANRTQDEARNSNGSLFFEGDKIYSYGHHFCIAKHVTNSKGARAVHFTTRDYSTTTAKHKNFVRRAIHRDTPTFYLSDIDCKPSAGIADYKVRVREYALAASRARSGAGWKLARLDAEVAEANLFAQFNRLKTRITVEGIDKLRDITKAKVSQARVAQAKREAEAEARKAEQLAAWLKGESDYPPYTNVDHLRVKGDEVQTSRGVSVPIEHARKLYLLAKAVRSKGEVWKANGHTFHIGVYTVDSIEADGTIKAGCHVIAWAEAERVGEQICVG